MRSVDIARAFASAAAHYAPRAGLQNVVAQDLAAMLAERTAPASILELGCGTGFLTKLLAQAFPEANYTATDAAHAMLEQARLACPPRVRFQALDFERHEPPHSTQWVVSSLALQWAADIGPVLRRFWPGAGLMAFSTLLRGTFAQWSQWCEMHGVTSGVIPLPGDAEMEAMLRLPHSASCMEVREYTVSYTSPLNFVRTLRSIGAHTSQQGYAPQLELVRLLRRDRAPMDVTYRVAYCFIQRT